jgi:hypothetical protein
MKESGTSRTLWQILAEVSEEEDPVRMGELVKELTTLLDAEKASGKDEAR